LIELPDESIWKNVQTTSDENCLERAGSTLISGAPQNHIPEMSKYASGRIGGPLSIGFPDPLKMRPSMSRDTGVFKTFH